MERGGEMKGGEKYFEDIILPGVRESRKEIKLIGRKNSWHLILK